MKIKNENDFLGFLISIKNENDDVSVIKTFRESGLSNIDCAHYFKSLSSKGLLDFIDTDTYHLYPHGISSYVSPLKRLSLWVAKLLVLTIKNLIVYIAGILSAVIAGVILGLIQ